MKNCFDSEFSLLKLIRLYESYLTIFFLREGIVDIKTREKKRFIQRRDDISAKKCIEKLHEFEYFDRSTLPCAADDAANVISKSKLNWTPTISLKNKLKLN